MKGYQYLENDFFDLCKTREIGRVPMLLYIYLRGLYCRFQKPIFFCFDKQIKGHLCISQSTLSRARDYLQKRGVITFKSGKGQEPTQYLILDSVLAPERVDKKRPRVDRTKQRYGHIVQSIYKSYENNKDKIPFKRFQGMLDQDREFLRSKGLI